MKRTLAVLVAAVLSCIAAPAQAPERGPATSLYLKLRDSGLDTARVMRIRDVSLDREDLHIKLEDGIIAFSTAANGHITSAYFEGEGVVLLVPPDRVEKWSLNVFTGAAILEERFSTAFLRFNDDTAAEIARYGRPVDPAEATAFVAKWDGVTRNLSAVGAARINATILNSQRIAPDGTISYQRDPNDRLLVARVLGQRSGVFDLVYDSLQAEQISVGNAANVNGAEWYDIWTSFPMRSVRQGRRDASTRATIATQASAEAAAVDQISISSYKINARVLPPETIEVDATFEAVHSKGGERVLRLELSRYLSVREAYLDGTPVEFVQNEALQGTQLARRGNDTLALVFPEAMKAGRKYTVRLVYGGEVMSDAGGGLMYLGARGTWYPNRGLNMATFDMQFRYPAEWRLVATGKRVAQQEDPVTRVITARYVSDRPIPLAGFNLGKWVEARAQSSVGDVFVYAGGVETALAEMRRPTIVTVPDVRGGAVVHRRVQSAPPPSPANHAQSAADKAARDLEWLSARLGPFPFSSVSLTQVPGTDSNSWPGLVYLSSMVLLAPEERRNAHLGRWGDLVYDHLMTTHELVHQWIGDLIIWRSYREQWLVEALSNYIALLKLEQQNPTAFRAILDHYRDELLEENQDGIIFSEAGPVTLGGRLNSSRFPNGFIAISYGRGTWLIHMLRHMLLDTADAKSKAARGEANEPFFRAMRTLRQRFEGRDITTRDLQAIFEEHIPANVRFENRKSLDWFFDEWINGTAVPEFMLSDVKITGGVARGKIVQKHGPATLVTSIPLYSDGKTPVLVGRVFAEGEQTHFRLNVPAGTRKLVLDPFGTVLRR